MKIVDIKRLRELMNGSKKPHAVILVFSNSCPHCVSLMPEWENLERQVQQDNTLKTNPECYISKVQGENTSMFPELKPDSIRGVPTIKFLKNGVLSGDYEEASKPRDAENILNWVRSKIKRSNKSKSHSTNNIKMDIVDETDVDNEYENIGNSYDTIKPFSIDAKNSIADEIEQEEEKKMMRLIYLVNVELHVNLDVNLELILNVIQHVKLKK